MFIDTSLNSVSTVLANLYHSFLEAAVRCFEYVRTLAKVRTTHSHLLISKSPTNPAVHFAADAAWSIKPRRDFATIDSH